MHTSWNTGMILIISLLNKTNWLVDYIYTCITIFIDIEEKKCCISIAYFIFVNGIIIDPTRLYCLQIDQSLNVLVSLFSLVTLSRWISFVLFYLLSSNWCLYICSHISTLLVSSNTRGDDGPTVSLFSFMDRLLDKWCNLLRE